ncbi:YncE family protein [Pseudomonas sp. MF7453]|uniref:YncE family protein n=1 Tax=Pseudomonas sp. MF7453 TaxID=2797539 RepID=UPI0018E76503|nr:YncE family protein [Pseudomonas sp. MF7453]MBJ2217525.1 YncE family protein [Pseudomonas sp. MF7453]
MTNDLLPTVSAARLSADRLPNAPAHQNAGATLPFSDLDLIIPNLTAIAGTDGALNNAALTVNAVGVICILLAWAEQAAGDFVYLELNGIEVDHYTVTDDDAMQRKHVKLAIESVRFIDQADNILQAFVRRLSGTTGHTKAFSIWVDTKAPGGRDPQVSTPLINENLAGITFEDTTIEAFGVVNPADAQKGVKMIIDNYPVNRAVDQVHHRKEGDVIYISIGGVFVTHRVTSFEASRTAPIIITVYNGTWLQVTPGPNILEWFVKDKAGNQSIGFSIPRLIQNRTGGGTVPQLIEGHVTESEYDADTDEEYIDTDVHTDDLNFEVPLRGHGWQVNDQIQVTYSGLTNNGERLDHTESHWVLQPNLVRVLIRLPFNNFIELLGGGRLLAFYERVRSNELNTPSNAVIYSIRGKAVDNRRPAPQVRNLENGALPEIDPVSIIVPGTRLGVNDKVDLVIEGRTTTGDVVYESFSEFSQGLDIDYLLDYSLFEPLKGSTFTAYYIVNNDAANPSQSITIPVGNISVLLPPPRSPEAPAPDHQFDELINKGNLRVLVDPHSSISLNDEVRVVATGSKPGGSFTFAWLKVTSAWFGFPLPFTLARAIVLANKGAIVALHWEVRTLPTDTPRKSLPLVVKVGAALQLTECPTLLEATQVSPCTMRLNPLNVWTPSPRITTLRVRYPMLGSDLVTLRIEGKPGVGTPNIPSKPGIPDAGHDYITFAPLSDYVAAYVGETFTVHFDVLRDGITTQSPRLTVDVDSFSAQTLNLLSVPEAVNGVINPNEANSVQIRAWPFFRAGRAVGINLYSTTDLALRRAVDVTPAEVSAGRTLDHIPAEYFEDFADDTEVRVEGWVSLDGYNCEETAQHFNVATYRIRRAGGEIVREIEVGNGPTYIVASRDGKKVCVANGRTPSISVIDLESNTVRTVNTVGSVVHGLALHPSDSRLFFSVAGASTMQSTPILNISNFTFRYFYRLGADARAICLNPNGTQLFIGVTPPHHPYIYFLNATLETYIGSVDTRQTNSTAITTNPQATALFAVTDHTMRVNIATRVLTHTIANNGIASALAHSPLFAPLERLFVCIPNLGAVAIYNTEKDDLKLVKSLTGLATPRGVAFHPVKRLAYVTEFASNTVRIIDTTTEELVGSIPGFNQPTGLACSEDGRYLYVSNFGNNTVAVVNV